MSLQKQEFNQSIEYLKKAEVYSTSQQQKVYFISKIKVITYNNIACFYRKTGKIKIALNYLQQALSMELLLPQSNSLSDTYLNLCAVLSQQDRHEEALQHIYLSIIMLQHELLTKTLGCVDLKKNTTNSFSSRSESQSRYLEQETAPIVNPIQMDQLQGRVAVLVVAYHNLGVEMEFLKKNLEASKIFSSALTLGEQNLNKNHQMLKILRKLNQREVVDNDKILKLNLPRLENRTRQRKLNISFSPMSKRNYSQKLSTKMSQHMRNLSTNAKRRPDNILFVPGVSRYENSESKLEPVKCKTQQIIRLKSGNCVLKAQQLRSIDNSDS